MASVKRSGVEECGGIFPNAFIAEMLVGGYAFLARSTNFLAMLSVAGRFFRRYAGCQALFGHYDAMPSSHLGV